MEKFWVILGNFATIYALSCGEKLSPKSTFVEKNDKMRSACGQPDRKISTYFDDFPQRGCPKFDCGFYSKYLQMIAFKC